MKGVKRKKNIATQELPGHNYPAGFAYVYMPADVDREAYIRNCFNTNTVSITNENGQYLHRVPVDKVSMQFVEFPESTEELGSPVLVQNIKPNNTVVITSVFSASGDVEFSEEHQYKFRKQQDDRYGEVLINGKRGQVQVNCEGDSEGGEYYESVTNDNKTAKKYVKVDGDYTVENDGKIQFNSTKTIKFRIFDPEVNEKETIFEYNKSEGFRYKDEFENEIIIEQGQITINSQTINHNKGSEAMVLGNTLKSIIDEILSTLTSTQVITSIGNQPLLTAAQFNSIQSKTQQFLSQLSKLE